MRIALVLGVLALLFGAHDAEAGKKKKLKYHFEVLDVKASEGVEGAVAADVLAILDAECRKQFAAHPQLATDMTTAPDPATNGKGYSKWLKKKKLKGAYRVSISLTQYSEEVEDTPKGDGTKRIVVRLDLHMYGDTIPDRKLGFEGDGGSTVKEDLGKKIRPKDREHAIKSAIELAVSDAIAESLEKLALPPAKPSKN